MDIDIILEADVTPEQMVELGVEAERLGIRALWSSNYHYQWDAFLSLVPLAMYLTKQSFDRLKKRNWKIEIRDWGSVVAMGPGEGPVGG